MKLDKEFLIVSSISMAIFNTIFQVVMSIFYYTGGDPIKVAKGFNFFFMFPFCFFVVCLLGNIIYSNIKIQWK